MGVCRSTTLVHRRHNLTCGRCAPRGIVTTEGSCCFAFPLFRRRYPPRRCCSSGWLAAAPGPAVHHNRCQPKDSARSVPAHARNASTASTRPVYLEWPFLGGPCSARMGSQLRAVASIASTLLRLCDVAPPEVAPLVPVAPSVPVEVSPATSRQRFVTALATPPRIPLTPPWWVGGGTEAVGVSYLLTLWRGGRGSGRWRDALPTGPERPEMVRRGGRTGLLPTGAVRRARASASGHAGGRVAARRAGRGAPRVRAVGARLTRPASLPSATRGWNEGLRGFHQAVGCPVRAPACRELSACVGGPTESKRHPCPADTCLVRGST